MRPISRFIMLILAIPLLFLSGCASPGKGSVRPAVPVKGRVMIIPTVNLGVYGSQQEGAKCPVSGRVVRTGPIDENAVQVLTDALVTSMSELPDVSLLTPTQAEGAISKVMAMPGNEPSDAKLWRHAGRQMAAEHFAVIVVYRYKERVGKNYGVEAPASLGFGLHLVHVGDGAVVWSGWYDETQEPLNRNLLQLGTFLSRKGQWITVRDMADQAVRRMVDQMIAN